MNSYHSYNMLIKCENTMLQWCTKATETGLIMNYHALAPVKYKRSVVSGLIHRIIDAFSTWEHFYESLMKVKQHYAATNILQYFLN